MCNRPDIARSLRRQAGFTLVELMLVLAGATTLAALALPQFNNFLESQRARNAARLVERELQVARLKAVGTSRALRVRFNCPAAGQLRILEVTGVAATDNSTSRCNPATFPSPGPQDTLKSTPSLDSPVIYLPKGTTVAGPALNYEFSPAGNVYSVSASNVVTAVTGDVTLTVTRGSYSKTVTMNALGRVRLN